MKVNISKKESVKIAEDMYGLFFEDINYGLDGGLHAEMLENRNFEAVFAGGTKYNYTTTYDGKYGWNMYEGQENGSSIWCDSKDSLNQENPHYLVFASQGKDASFSNKAYDGLYLKAGMKYNVTFYANVLEGQPKVVVSVKKDGEILTEAAVSLENQNNGWNKYQCTLLAEKSASKADFTVALTEKAVVAFDQFSMIPEDAVYGIFRKDLAEKLAALKPSFLRFPGGCIIEGNTLENRYRWKNSVGPLEKRKFNWSRWAVHSLQLAEDMEDEKEKEAIRNLYAHYGQTLGVGYYEYFLLCEYLGAKAIPVVNVGLACQFMSLEIVPADSEEMEEYIQDALDLIEFANGSADTQWGKVRTEMGHAEPFNLEYIGIGNEQWETEKTEFFKRYELFEQRIHEKYPEIKLIGSAGPDVSSDKYENAWDFFEKHAEKQKNFTYAVDEHYYVSPEWLYENVHFYDNYNRDIKVFAGEYACHIPERAAKMNRPDANTLGAALAEAAFLTGVEHNSDVVVLASYAPLFARIGYTQWSPDMIWFNGGQSYVTPSYYVQQMYSCNRGICTLSTDWSQEKEQEEKVYLSAVINEQKEIIVKAVNASDTEKVLELTSDEFQICKEMIKVIELSGNPDDYNSIQNQNQVKPEVYSTQNIVTLKPYSFSVICLKTL